MIGELGWIDWRSALYKPADHDHIALCIDRERAGHAAIDKLEIDQPVAQLGANDFCSGGAGPPITQNVEIALL